MTFIDNELPLSASGLESRRSIGLAVIFTATIFLSATLLFSVQPMFTKLILPLLGGASNVWNTAMVFFQAMLLGGYIYAHLVSKYLPVKAQIAVHACVTAAGFLFLPLAVPENIVLPESGMPTFWLLGLFGITVIFCILRVMRPVSLSSVRILSLSNQIYVWAAKHLAGLLDMRHY